MKTEQPARLPLFSLGDLYMTPGARGVLIESSQSPMVFLQRHIIGDWGDLCDEDKHLNDESVQIGSRIFSAYIAKNRAKLWIITEADRTSTTILTPDEY